MAANSFTAGAEATQLFPKDGYPNGIAIQWYSGGTINLNLGAPAEAGKGIALNQDNPVYKHESKTRPSISVIRAADSDGLGGYLTF
jgi:hypothetical protein